MSTSVYYKGSKLIDVNNNTKTLLTSGKYLEDNVILTDVTSGGGNDFIVTLSQNAYGSLTMDKTFSEIISAFSAGKKIAAYGDGSPYYAGSIYVDEENFDYVNVSAYSFSGNYLSAVYCEDSYTLLSTISWLQGTNYYYDPVNMNATPSDVASGKRFINYSGFQVGTATGGGGGFTADDIAMRTISGDMSGSATYISNYAFNGCHSLTTASFPNATSIGGSAFQYCDALTTISFPNVTSIGTNAFGYCSELTTVSFPNVTNIGLSAFQYCYALTTISFPSATTIGSYAFGYCSELTTVSFPNVTSIGTYAFRDCYKLTTASFPNVTAMSNYAFRNCYNLLSFYLLGSSIPTLLNSNVFLSTPIDGYTTSTGGVYGSIFVPSSLYDQYIVATIWSDYAARIVSV